MILKPDDPLIIEYIDSRPTLTRPRGNQSGRSALYKDIYAAFDIETSNYEYNGQIINFMYSWALQLDEEITIIGRRWEEFYNLKNWIAEILHGVSIVVFCHNLKYEFQYLRPLGFGVNDVLAAERREVIKCYSEPFEFRCSYKLTGVSLSKLTENVKHKKLDGEIFDYSKTRFPWDELTPYELEYIQNDVIGLVEAIKQRNEIYKDNLYTMPITLTGYIRRIIRRQMRTYNLNQREKIKINEEVYKLLAGAFRGGNAVFNRYYAGEIVHDVLTKDRSSAYIFELLFKDFPIADWQPVEEPTADDLIKYIYTRGRAVVAMVVFNNIKLKRQSDPAPYIPVNKCEIRGKSKTASGRILEAEQIAICVTDIDWKLIVEQYEFETFFPLKMFKNRYGKLPKQILELIPGLYKRKTELKGKDDIQYKIAKELMNSIFGLMAQNPAKEKIYYHDGKWEIGTAGPAANIEQFNKGAFLSYSWGVWIAAHSRAELQKMIRAAGDDFLYSDTDSIYYRAATENHKAIEKVVKDAEKAGSSCQAVDIYGEIHTIGAWESGGKIDKFIAVGQKQYAYEDKSGIHIAIAGVNKEIGGQELGDLSKLEDAEDGFIFDKAGGNEAIYTDFASGEIEVDGNKIEITPFIVIRPRQYKMGLFQEYKNVYSHPEFWVKFIEDRGHNKNEYIFG